MSHYWWLPIVAIVLLTAAYLWYPRRGTSRRVRLVQAKRRFHAQRERLEAKFIQLAASAAKPDAPRWADCTFADDVAYVRNRTTGELSAFVAVSIGTEEFDRSPPRRGRCGRQPSGRHGRLPLRPGSLGDRRPGHSQSQPQRSCPPPWRQSGVDRRGVGPPSLLTAGTDRLRHGSGSDNGQSNEQRGRESLLGEWPSCGAQQAKTPDPFISSALALPPTTSAAKDRRQN